QQYHQVGAAFRIAPVAAHGTETPGGEVQREVDPRQHHEEHAYQLDDRAVVVADAGVVGREAADRHGGETVTDGIEQAHARRPVGQSARQGQAGVDEPEHLRRFGDAWSQLVVLQRARHLRPVQLHAADAQQRQYRHRQYDDPHAAEPLQLLPVEQQRPGQGIEPGDDSGAGGGQAGEGFEHRIGHAQIGQLQQVQRYRPEQAQHRPEKYGDQIAVPGTQLVALVAYRQPD